MTEGFERLIEESGMSPRESCMITNVEFRGQRAKGCPSRQNSTSRSTFLTRTNRCIMVIGSDFEIKSTPSSHLLFMNRLAV